jgi:hypothetical protein
MKAELNESNPRALKKVYKDYLDSTANKGTWMSPVLQSEIKRQHYLVDKTTSLADLTTVATVPSWFTATGFKGVQPLTGPAQSHLKMDFESTPTGWIGIYGQTQKYRLTFGIARTTLSPSKDSSTSIMSFFGGLGYKDDKGEEQWKPFHNLFSGADDQFTQTDTSIVVNLSKDNYCIIDLTKDPVIRCKITINNTTFNITGNPVEKAVYNGKGGCVPICFGGVGTNYISFTNVKLTINDEEGLGWLDHQWLSAGVPNSFIEQFIFGLITKGKQKTGPKWIWMALQKTDDLQTTTEQYQGTVVIDGTIKKGQTIPASFIYYKNGTVVDYAISGSVKVLDMVSGYPVVLELTIGDDKFNINPIGNAVNEVILNNGTQNWEGPAQVTQNGKPWGVGFLEVNNMKPGNTAIEDVLKDQGIIEDSLQFPAYWSNALLIPIIVICIILAPIVIFLILKNKR